MSAALLRKIVKQRVRQIHIENVAAAPTNPVIKPGMVFTSGYKAPMPMPPDSSRLIRRAVERKLARQLGVSK